MSEKAEEDISLTPAKLEEAVCNAEWNLIPEKLRGIFLAVVCCLVPLKPSLRSGFNRVISASIFLHKADSSQVNIQNFLQALQQQLKEEQRQEEQQDKEIKQVYFSKDDDADGFYGSLKEDVDQLFNLSPKASKKKRTSKKHNRKPSYYNPLRSSQKFRLSPNNPLEVGDKLQYDVSSESYDRQNNPNEYSKVYIILNSEAIRKSKNKGKLNAVLSSLLDAIPQQRHNRHQDQVDQGVWRDLSSAKHNRKQKKRDWFQALNELDQDKYDRYQENYDRYQDKNDRYQDRNDGYQDRNDRYQDKYDRYQDNNDRYQDNNDQYQNKNDQYQGKSDRYKGKSDRYQDKDDRFLEDWYLEQQERGRSYDQLRRKMLRGSDEGVGQNIEGSDPRPMRHKQERRGPGARSRQLRNRGSYGGGGSSGHTPIPYMNQKGDIYERDN